MVADLKGYSCLLFLDLDGVLDGGDTVVDSRGAVVYDHYNHVFNPRCVENLAWLIRESRAGIVLSSDWRKRDFTKRYEGEGKGYQQWCETPTKMREFWAYRKLPGTVVDSTPRFFLALEDKDIWTLPRGVEIEAWRLRHKMTKTPYAIIDDSDDMLLQQIDRFVHVNSDSGLTREDARRALAILRTPTRW